ncbi:MAG: hypothetical protein MZV64_44305 [Ignavibacteriales bacterium]|nr:hypothetical protein [Ignavibacteriales bacterium]
MLGLLGGAAGLALAWAGLRALVTIGPALPRLAEVSIRPATFGFAMGVAMVAALLAAAFPALGGRRGTWWIPSSRAASPPAWGGLAAARCAPWQRPRSRWHSSSWSYSGSSCAAASRSSAWIQASATSATCWPSS